MRGIVGVAIATATATATATAAAGAVTLTAAAATTTTTTTAAAATRTLLRVHNAHRQSLATGRVHACRESVAAHRDPQKVDRPRVRHAVCDAAVHPEGRCPPPRRRRLQQRSAAIMLQDCRVPRRRQPCTRRAPRP